MYVPGWSSARIAERFGVTTSTVHKRTLRLASAVTHRC
ncbi:hypothetical protein [Amycolatopsis bartoniae]